MLLPDFNHYSARFNPLLEVDRIVKFRHRRQIAQRNTCRTVYYSRRCTLRLLYIGSCPVGKSGRSLRRIRGLGASQSRHGQKRQQPAGAFRLLGKRPKCTVLISFHAIHSTVWPKRVFREAPLRSRRMRNTSGFLPSGQKIRGTGFGLLALLVLALNPWHIMISRWALESNLLPFSFCSVFFHY